MKLIFTKDYTEDDDCLPWNHYDHPLINDVQPEQPFPELF